MPTPDFYLSSAGEYTLLAEPRACWTRARLRDPVRDDYLLVEIEPVLPGQSFGLGAADIKLLILSTKLQGFTLFPITKWPTYVYVARVLDDAILRTRYFDQRQVELIAWATIFPNRAEADALAAQFAR
jgi:hypothetical protein